MGRSLRRWLPRLQPLEQFFMLGGIVMIVSSIVMVMVPWPVDEGNAQVQTVQGAVFEFDGGGRQAQGHHVAMGGGDQYSRVRMDADAVAVNVSLGEQGGATNANTDTARLQIDLVSRRLDLSLRDLIVIIPLHLPGPWASSAWPFSAFSAEFGSPI